MLQSVSLSVLEPPAANPHRKIDRWAIERLASSIRQDGILHNLVVTPLGGRGKKERDQIVSGARRLFGRSIKYLKAGGIVLHTRLPRTNPFLALNGYVPRHPGMSKIQCPALS